MCSVFNSDINYFIIFNFFVSRDLVNINFNVASLKLIIYNNVLL